MGIRNKKSSELTNTLILFHVLNIFSNSQNNFKNTYVFFYVYMSFSFVILNLQNNPQRY